MRTIKFKTTEYNLVDNVNALAASFQATILKEDYTIESIASEATNANQIVVSEDGETIAIYNGYTDLFVVTLYKNVKIGEEIVDTVSIELLNHDMQSQISALYTTVQDVQDEQATHDAAIINIGEEINTIVDNQSTTDLAIEDLAEAVDELSDSQATQDLAIEDLAEAVSELTPEEE